MEINLTKLGEQAIESTAGQTKMRLSENASSMVFQMFTKNVYSNPIGTIVREIASNCFDSHVEAKVDSPVVIRKHKDKETGTHYVSFIDFGVGMSPDRIYKIYGTYFESTKRVDNTQIGGFGIGGKTPLAYKRSTGQGEGEYDNSFFVVTIHEGIKYFYCMFEGADSPMISELHQEPTTERNGTEIQIPILEKDLKTFEAEMTRQLYYFENIIFEGFEYKNKYDDEMVYPLDNDYQIIRGENFLFRGDDYSNVMHICLGRVAYPIDYSVLGLDSNDYRLPIALKLEVGDVGVTVSRESLDYNENTIKLLKKKLEEAKAEIISLISKQYEDIRTLEQYFTVKNDFGKLEFPNGESLYVGNLIKQKDIDFSNFKYTLTKMPSDRDLFKFFFEAQILGNKPRKNRYGTYKNSNIVFNGTYKELKSKDNLVYVDGEFKRKIIKQAYLKETYGTYYLIKQRNLASSWIRKDVADLFNVNVDVVVDDNNVIVDKFVKKLVKMQAEYFKIITKNVESYDELEVPEDFIANRKRGAGITPELRKTTIPVDFMNGYAKSRVKLSVLFDYNMPIFYGTPDDSNKLKSAVGLYKILFNEHGVVRYENYGSLKTYNDEKSSIAFVQVARGNIKHMEHCKNAKPISNFFLTMLRRKETMVTEFFRNDNLITDFNNLGDFYRKGFINRIDEAWGTKVDEIKDYIKNIPSKYKNSDIRWKRSILKSYFEVDNITPTKEQEDVRTKIDELIKLEEDNQKTLTYLNKPWQASYLEDEHIMIYQVAMKL